MKTILVAVTLGLALGVAAAQRQKPEQYPGQREHKEPPADYFCEQVADAAHRCDCPGMQKDPMCKKDPEGPEEETGPTMEESQKCSVYCWKDHCRCKRACDT